MSSSTLLSLGYNRLTMLSPSHYPILQLTRPRWLWGPHQPNVTSSMPIRGCTNATRAHNHTRWKHTNHPNPHNPLPHNHKETPQHITLIKWGNFQNRFQGTFRTWEVRHSSIFVLGSSRSHTQRHLGSNCNLLRRSHGCPNHDNPRTQNPQPKDAQYRVKTQERSSQSQSVSDGVHERTDFWVKSEKRRLRQDSVWG